MYANLTDIALSPQQDVKYAKELRQYYVEKALQFQPKIAQQKMDPELRDQLIMHHLTNFKKVKGG